MKSPIHLENRDQSGVRLFSPTAARNKGPIGEILVKQLPQEARILEIASGSGEHGFHICGLRRDIIWQPSDPRNLEWGVRKLSRVKHIFSEQGFNLRARIVMPRENRCLIFEKS